MSNVIIVIFTIILVWSVGIVAGFLFSLMVRKRKAYSGIMKIIREEDKIVYSLELHEDPIMLEHVSEVIFKVETSDESSNRK